MDTTFMMKWWAARQQHAAIQTLKAIQDAFDMACQESRAERVVSIDRRGTRNKLAVQIIAAAIEGGERDPERLRAYALEEIRPKAMPSPFAAFSAPL